MIKLLDILNEIKIDTSTRLTNISFDTLKNLKSGDIVSIANYKWKVIENYPISEMIKLLCIEGNIINDKPFTIHYYQIGNRK